jgi:hypothetical protein
MSNDAWTQILATLYAMPTAEFTAARNQAAKDMRPEDRELAGRIATLRKSTPSAWLINRLVATEAATVDRLLDLGDELRDAQDALDRDALADLSKQRKAAIAELRAALATVATEAGVNASEAVLDEAVQTLLAGTVDEQAADAVRSGLLLRPLVAYGLEVDVVDAVAGGAVAQRPRREPREVLDLESAREARRAAAEAKTRATEAAATARSLGSRLAKQELRAAALREEREVLESRLDEVLAEAARLEREIRSTRADRDAAEAAAETWRGASS